MGNIGVGKTTLTTLLKKHFSEKGIEFNLEYEGQDENKYMQDYYSDMKRWAFACQIDFLKSKFASDLKTSDTNSNWIIDRIMEEDVFVFASIQYDFGNIDDRDWQNYLDVYELMKPHVPKYDFIIYLHSSPERIANNIIKRGRDYEQDLNLRYITSLSTKYDELVMCLNKNNETIITIECDSLDFEHNVEDFEKIIEKIEPYCNFQTIK